MSSLSSPAGPRNLVNAQQVAGSAQQQGDQSVGLGSPQVREYSACRWVGLGRKTALILVGDEVDL